MPLDQYYFTSWITWTEINGFATLSQDFKYYIPTYLDTNVQKIRTRQKK